MRLLNPQTGMWYNVEDTPSNPFMNANNPIGIYGQQLSQSAPQPVQPQSSAPGISNYIAGPAANIEEVKAKPITPGTFNMFLNRAAGEVYLSCMNSDGGKDILTFRLHIDAPDNINNSQGAPAPGVDLSEVYKRLDELKNMIGGAENAEPHADDDGNAAGEKRGKLAAGGKTDGGK